MNTSTTATRVLAWCLHLLVMGLLVLTVVRAVAGDAPHAGAVAATAVVLAVTYAIGPLLPVVARSPRAAALWLIAVGAVWLVLLTLSAEAVWLAFPLYFVQLHLLPRRGGLIAVVLTAITAAAGFAAHQDAVTPAAGIGPALGAAVAVAVVWGYRTLYHESERRRMLIDELTATRADLAAAQHRAGVLQERERLAREIHDTLAQGLSSIQLLLRAAERALPSNIDAATGYVEQARIAAVDNLAEARQFVAALSPPALTDSTLADALDRLCMTTAARHPFVARFHLTGTPVALPTAHEVALLRIAQSALANAANHADAANVAVTLSFLDDEVAVDIVDDGRGFVPDGVPRPGKDGDGFGLAAMRSRILDLDGTFTVESAPGRGTALAARLPLPPPTEPAATEVTE
ncbi:sensor histidine kinase [Rhodococcus sp. SJ-2]